jgi:hypothetical protein
MMDTSMPVTVSWLTPNRTMLIVMAGDVTLAEIPMPQIRDMLVNAPHKLNVLHDLTAMNALHINWAQLPATVQELRHPNIDNTYYIGGNPNPILVALMRFTAALARQRVYVFGTMEAAMHHLQKQQTA